MEMFAACVTTDEETVAVLKKERDSLVEFLRQEEGKSWSSDRTNATTR